MEKKHISYYTVELNRGYAIDGNLIGRNFLVHREGTTQFIRVVIPEERRNHIVSQLSGKSYGGYLSEWKKEFLSCYIPIDNKAVPFVNAFDMEIISTDSELDCQSFFVEEHDNYIMLIDNILNFVQLSNPSSIVHPNKLTTRNIRSFQINEAGHVFFDMSGESENCYSPLNFSNIKWAIKNANKKISQQWAMYCHSWDYFYKNDFKGCVMHSGNVLDILFTSKIDSYFKDHTVPNELAAYVNKRMTGLRQKYNALIDLSIRFPKLSILKFIDVRNKATHGKYIPRREDAELGIKIIEMLLNEWHISKLANE